MKELKEKHKEEFKLELLKNCFDFIKQAFNQKNFSFNSFLNKFL